MTHVFGSLRLRRADGYEPVRLECYWPGKTPAQWSSETLTVEFAAVPENELREGVSDIATPRPASDAPGQSPRKPAAAATTGERHLVARELSNADPPTAKRSTRRAKAATRDDMPTGSLSLHGKDAVETTEASTLVPNRVPSTPDAHTQPQVSDRLTNGSVRMTEVEGSAPTRVRMAARSPAKIREIGVILPRASLPQIFTLLGASRRLGSASANQITLASSTEPITVDNASKFNPDGAAMRSQSNNKG